MSDCEHIREMMEAYIDGELSTSERVSFEAHIAVCNVCRAALEKEKSLLNALRTMPTVPAPEVLRTRVMARLRAEVPVIQKSPVAGFLQSIFALRGLYYAYTAALTILVIFLGFRFLHPLAQRRGGIMKPKGELTERMPAVNATSMPSAPASAPVPREVAAFQERAPEGIFTGGKAEVRRAVPINELLKQYGAEAVSISKESPEKHEMKYVFLLPTERYADFEKDIRGRDVKILKVSELPASAALQKKAEGAAVIEIQRLDKKGVKKVPQVGNGVFFSHEAEVTAARPVEADRIRALGLKETEAEKAKDIIRKSRSLANALEGYYVYEDGKKYEKAGRERIQTLEEARTSVTTPTLSLGYYAVPAKQPPEGTVKPKTSYYYIEMLVGQSFTYEPTNGTVTAGDVSRVKQ